LHRDLIDLLACPACPGDKPLRLEITEEAAGDVVTGTLNCEACKQSYSIEKSIPRFVQPEQDYCGNFGFQWQQWRTLQIDRLSGHSLSEQRMLSDSRWPRDWFSGKLILDAGCGAGRFADVAATLGARVVAVDISTAIDACRETTFVHDSDPNAGRVFGIQASLFDLPLRNGVFDAVYCMGVIQHTPDPTALMGRLPAFLKPGGRLIYNFYEEGLWRRLQLVKYALRLFTPHFSIDHNLSLSRFLVGVFFPLTKWLAKIPKVRILNHFIPIAAVHEPTLTPQQQRAWTLLDTFDWYGARYEKRQHHQYVANILTEAGLENVESVPGICRGTRPASGGNTSSV
jgi:2-polyprenyl-3-methyl-5-hydroxy-6-metoxy-1,4-benzoquinol methylase